TAMLDDRHHLDQVDAFEARRMSDTAANLAVSLTYASDEQANARGERLAQANAAVNLAISWRTLAAMCEADDLATEPAASGRYEVSTPEQLERLARILRPDGIPVDIAYRPNSGMQVHTT
ncbi:hypothetical protein, partial [Rhodococcus rhodochrous]|uniref:hypothetical protein n=1 Tax=Rhodococcus rhodochrous TaxID=1829 RepID=UPI0016490AB3